MYDIKFPQFINTEYIKQCANCPHMELYAKTERAYADNGHDLVSHKLRCANLDACLRQIAQDSEKIGTCRVTVSAHGQNRR